MGFADWRKQVCPIPIAVFRSTPEKEAKWASILDFRQGQVLGGKGIPALEQATKNAAGKRKGLYMLTDLIHFWALRVGYYGVILVR
jgi:hypothetical protein